MIQKAALAAAGTVILAGSAYGGYMVIREQQANHEQTREIAPVDIREMTEKWSDEGTRDNLPEDAGDGKGSDRADIAGRIESIGDGYVDVAVFTNSGTDVKPSSGGRGTGMHKSGALKKQSEFEEGETRRVYFDDATEYLVGGADTERVETGIEDMEGGDVVSVWLTESDSDTMNASQVVIHGDGAGPPAG